MQCNTEHEQTVFGIGVLEVVYKTIKLVHALHKSIVEQNDLYTYALLS